MSAAQPIEIWPPRLSTSLQLVCAEVWGGNRPIDAPLELPGMRGKLYSRPCEGGRGGDVHYVSVCDSGLISHMCLADVVGHGEAVATVSSRLHGLLRRHINSMDQRTVLRRLNRQLAEIGFDAVTTAAAINYLPPRQRLSLSYAGHPPAWLYRAAEDRWERLGGGDEVEDDRRLIDLPLAVDATTSFTAHTVRVAYGDRLLVLTDGVLEAPNASGELFGTQRLEELLDQQRFASAAETADTIIEALLAWVRPAQLAHDDVTLLAVEFEPGPRGPAMWHAIKNRILRPQGNSNDEIFDDPRQLVTA
jgi:sigma-B regulation protein RsbU (phosphoserine phosphatase)